MAVCNAVVALAAAKFGAAALEAERKLGAAFALAVAWELAAEMDLAGIAELHRSVELAVALVSDLQAIAGRLDVRRERLCRGRL
jgi:hypothetical protein